MDMLFFAAKKAFSALLYPIGTCLALLFTALILWRRSPKNRLSPSLVLLAAAWLLIGALPITAYFIMRPLENAAGPRVDPEALKKLGVKSILVLSGDSPADWRIIEGIRLWRHLPNGRLFVSGGREDEVFLNRSLPLEMGVAENALRIDIGAFDTEDETKLYSKIIGTRPFALVTSAYHIPRAMRLFRKAGLNPIPAPCEYRAKKLQPLPSCILPKADALLTTQLAMHEYVGIAWLGLKERVLPKNQIRSY